MGYRDERWKYSVIDAFTPLESVKGWKKCKKCKEFPRVWIFDNGSYAKCCCGEKYGPPQATSESISEVLRRTGGVAEYSRDNLRLAWNTRVDTLGDTP
jgi:hypothetical protein